MSGIGRTNAGGGASLRDTDAILRVQAPAGSTVTISKGGISKSDNGHENADDNTVYDYYFIIHQSKFDSVNAWTVTASLGDKYPMVNTIIIDSANEYDIIIPIYRLNLYKDGDENISVTGGLSAYPYKAINTGSTEINPTVTKNASSIRFTSGSSPNYQAFVFSANNKIDLTDYSTIKLIVTENSAYSSSSHPTIFTTTELVNNYDRDAYVDMSGNGTFSLDISALSGEKYVSIQFAGSRNYAFTMTEWWLE